jgi:hypothetical protein
MKTDLYDSSPTLSGTLAKLKAQGYTHDFNVSIDCIYCHHSELKMFPDDFQIDHFFRFEGESDPADAAILYAISSEKHQVRGVLVNGYGIYSETLTNEMLSKLKTHV